MYAGGKRGNAGAGCFAGLRRVWRIAAGAAGFVSGPTSLVHGFTDMPGITVGGEDNLLL